LPAKQTELSSLEEKMSKPDFWDNQETAQATVSKLSALKAVIEPVNDALRNASDMQELFELAIEENDDETISQIEDDIANIGFA